MNVIQTADVKTKQYILLYSYFGCQKYNIHNLKTVPLIY